MKNLTKISIALYVGLVMLASVLTLASCKKNTPRLKCDPYKVEVATGKTTTVSVSGGTAPYTVLSSDIAIASATINQSTVTITGVKKGSAIVTVVDKV